LHDKFEEVDKILEQSNCTTVADAQNILQQEFNYNRSKEAVRQLLHRLGFKRRKIGTFPGKADKFDKWQEEQESFIEKLYDLIQDAENQTYDVVSNQVYSMYNEGYVNADFIVEYLAWLREEIYQDMSRPLHFVLDNARYQHCNYVKKQAEKYNIVLDFLPAYSPNLNLIERLWKYLKSLLGKQYHNNKTSFQNAIVELLESIGKKEHQERLRTLLNPLFQRFEKSQILTR